MKICGVPNCSIAHYAKGWCKRHWRHSERYEGWTAEQAAKADAEAGFVSGVTPVDEATRRKRNVQALARRNANYEHVLAQERAKRARKRASTPRSVLRAATRRGRKLPEPTRPEPAVCECCGNPPADSHGMCLDHCHKTGVFRGWLCNLCNQGIGKLGDDLAGIERAANYLKRRNLDLL
jgi:hypothetical protein